MSKPPRRASRAADRSTGRVAAGSYAGDRTSPRAGRRPRSRTGFSRRSFFDRYRGLIFGVGGLAVVGAAVAFLFLGATAKTYACSTIWQPTPTASPSPGTTPRLGYVQPDMGHLHDATDSQRYTYCPPASGSHYNLAGRGPITPRVYGPDDVTQPQGWVHNLEHGALVVLYKCPGPGCTDDGQAQFNQFFQSFPNSPVCNFPKGVVGPVITRFDDMAWPYAAIVWDRVLPLENFDAQQILTFFQQSAERNNPEPFCRQPSASPGASAPPAPGGSVAPGGSGASGAAPSAAPSGS